MMLGRREVKREGNRVDRGGDLFQEAIGGDRRHGKKKGDTN